MLQLPVYLDNNATTPLDPKVLEVMLPYFTRYFGNAASKDHVYGWQAAEAVDHAREQVAALIGAVPREIVFTSGATESDNLAIKGVLQMYAAKGNHVITCVTEHKAVLDTCIQVEKAGGEVTYLPVNADGLVNLEQLEAAIRPATVLIALMYANNETGVIQPVRAISAIARRHGILFFTDATQAAGKIPVDVEQDGIDLMAFSAHKLYGPKGTGALYVRRKNPRVKLAAQLDGGGHERGLRSGTLNVPGIAGFGKACELCRLHMEQEVQRLRVLRNRLEHGLLQSGRIFLNGHPQLRLPQVSNLLFQQSVDLSPVKGFRKNIALSSGAACTSASPEPSHVLLAMGLDTEQARHSLRFSLGRFTTEQEVDYVTEQVMSCLAHG